MINNAAIKKLKAGPKPYHVNVSKGLGIKVNKNGKKYWRFWWYHKNTGTKTISFGEYPHTTIEDALQKQNTCNTLISQGINPRWDNSGRWRHRRKARSANRAKLKRYMRNKFNRGLLLGIGIGVFSSALTSAVIQLLREQ